MTGRAGVETERYGITFRSKLEADWCTVFRRCKLKPIYEPYRFIYNGGSYLPDFSIEAPDIIHAENDYEDEGLLFYDAYDLGYGGAGDNPKAINPYYQLYVEIKPTWAIAKEEIRRAYPIIHEMKGLIVVVGKPTSYNMVLISKNAIELHGDGAGNVGDYNLDSKESNGWLYLDNKSNKLMYQRNFFGFPT